MCKSKIDGGVDMIALIDYDAGNMKSVEKAFEYLNEPVIITRDRREILDADRVVLPGVGAFGDAMEKLHQYELVEPIREVVASGKPFLGICLGLQLLFERSEESPGVEGLGLLPGEIVRIPKTEGLKIPHMGWNSIDIREGSRLFQGIDSQSYMYFVHSYYLRAKNPEDVAATTSYGTCIHAAVEHENLFACQFHPEKSSEKGLRILKNFASMR
jgi:glutamine amidotransferase